MPAATVKDTLVARYNDIESVAALFAAYPDQIAGVIIEPIGGNMGVVPPIDGYLRALRDLCDQNDSLLIFDEVITGFRLVLGGAPHQSGLPDEEIYLLRRLLPLFAVDSIPGIGHFAFEEHPRAVALAVKAALRDVVEQRLQVSMPGRLRIGVDGDMGTVPFRRHD